MLEYLDDPRTDDPEHGFVLTHQADESRHGYGSKP